MPIQNLSKGQKRKFRRLLEANVNPKRAYRLCELTWPMICQLVPELKSRIPEMSVNPNKKNKNKPTHTKLKVRDELQSMRRPSREREPDQAHFWHNPCDDQPHSPDRATRSNYWETTRRRERNHSSDKFETNQETFSDEPYRPPGTYTKEVLHTSYSKYRDVAGPSHARGYETNNRKRHHSSERDSLSHWEPPYKVTSSSHADRGQRNSWERDRSPVRTRRDASPMVCSPSCSYERTQLKYLDAEDTFQVKVKNGIRAVNFHYNDGNDDNPFSDQPYKPQEILSEAGSSMSINYWPDLDRPSRLGLRNETHPLKRTHTYSYAEDKRFREDPRNYQKITWESNVNLNYKESDRPSRDGLRNETNPMITTINIHDDSDEEHRGPSNKVVPVNVVNERYGFGEDLRNAISEKRSGPYFHLPESFENKDANVNKNNEPVRVGISNISPMTKQQMTLVQQSINKAIVQIAVQGAGPKFLGSTYKNGWIRMVCENHESRRWLEKVIPSLKPWPEARLSVKPQDELLKTVTVSILIPDKEGVTVTTALDLLRVQNPGLDTNNWKVLKVLKNLNGRPGQIVHLSIDEASFNALKLLDLKANLGMDKVTFWVRSTHVKKPLLPTPRPLLPTPRPLLPTPVIVFGKPSVDEVPLASSSAYSERQRDPKTSAGGDIGLKSKRPRRRVRHSRFARTAPIQEIDIKPIDIKPNLAEVATRSNLAEDSDTKEWHLSESFSSSDWVSW